MTPFVVEHFAGDGTAARCPSRTSSNLETGEEKLLDIDGAFIAIGHQPNSRIVKGQVDLDELGYVQTEGKSTRTNVPGVFAAGDLVDHTYRQAVTAAGTGCQAALDAEWYLRDLAPDPAEADWAQPEPRSESAARS